VAYKARIGGIRMLQDPITDMKEAKSLSFGQQHIDIFQLSWGPDDDGKTFDGPGPLARYAFEEGAKKGRHGLGSIYVLASGSGGKQSDSCHADGYVTSRYTLAISSVSRDNRRPTFSEKCAGILATAYSGERKLGTGLASASQLGDSCSQHDGTAASASIASGIIALVLEANPALTWRDVQHLTVLNARRERLIDDDPWTQNGAGLWVSQAFGFGLMDAEGMVNMAQSWETVGEQKSCTNEYELTGSWSGKVDAYHCNFSFNSIEHVHLGMNISSYPTPFKRGQLSISLESPAGTKSEIMTRRKNDMEEAGFNTGHWPLLSTHFWGENPSGIWNILIEVDEKPVENISGNIYLTIYGSKNSERDPRILNLEH